MLKGERKDTLARSKKPAGAGPLHQTFSGHGVVNVAGTWFAKDCIHPNKVGHNEIRAMFWTAITGEAAPM